MAFKAKYKGLCALDCGSPVLPGQDVQFNEKDKIEHVDCDDAATDEQYSYSADPAELLAPSQAAQDAARRAKCLNCYLVHAPGQKGCW